MNIKQLEMMKDLHLVNQKGGQGISIRRGERRDYVALEREGLVYFLSGFGRGRDYSIHLTDKGKQWVESQFAYAYKDMPHQGQTTYQNQNGEVILVC